LAEGDVQRLERAARGADGPLYDEILSGVTKSMMQDFEVPSTPFAIAVRNGRVAGAGPARTRDELASVGSILIPTATAT
jgi:hypothetical protein